MSSSSSSSSSSECKGKDQKLSHDTQKSKTKTKRKPTCVAIDIESKGANYAKHPILMIGVAWGTDITDIQSHYFCFDEAKAPFEKRCWDEFWVNNQATYKRIQEEARFLSSEEQWNAFVRWWNIFEKGLLPSETTIVSDNPSFDIASIDYQLFSRGLREYPLRRTTDNKYREICDPSEQIKGFPKSVRDQIESHAQKLYPHTHWAADDACHILALHFLVQDVRDLIAKTEMGGLTEMASSVLGKHAV